MKIHKAGKAIIAFSLFIIFSIYCVFMEISKCNEVCGYFIAFLCIALVVLIACFFRNPERKIIPDNQIVLVPADGKIVAIQEAFESEYMNKKCLKVSIFMSVLNVHVNRYPVSGIIRYTKYYPGKHFIAHYPKASEFNEHHSTVIENNCNIEIMVKQIAGIIAKRIVCICSYL